MKTVIAKIMLVTFLCVSALGVSQDPSKYPTQKGKSLVTLVKIKTGVIAVTTTTFDEFGTSTSTTTNVTIADIQTQRDALAVKLAAYDAFLTDLNSK